MRPAITFLCIQLSKTRAWLLYFSRKYLGYSEEEFWRLNLRKLHAQMAAINAQGGKDNNQKAFIDQIPGF